MVAQRQVAALHDLAARRSARPGTARCGGNHAPWWRWCAPPAACPCRRCRNRSPGPRSRRSAPSARRTAARRAPSSAACLRHQRAAALDARGADAGRDVLLEGLAEGAALAAVEGQHRLVLAHAGEGACDHVAATRPPPAPRAPSAARKPLKSPPHLAAKDGVARRRKRAAERYFANEWLRMMIRLPPPAHHIRLSSPAKA